MSDFDYDPYTGFICAAFRRRDLKVIAPTVACFDITKYQPRSSSKVVFSAFPSLMDNMLPDQMATEETTPLGRSNLLVDDEDDAAIFEQKPVKLHLQRLLGRGRSSRASSDPSTHLDVVSNEDGGAVLEGNENQPILDEYPPKETEKDEHPVQRKPYNFIAVSKIHFDDCGRMWFLDCGTAFGETEHEKHYRQPILWSFELVATEDRRLISKLFLRYELMTNVTHNGISDFVIDIHGNKCEDFHVYMANHVDNNIIVYSHRRAEDYPVNDENLTPVKSETKHLFQGQEYDFKGGVFSMSLAELNERGFRDVLYTLGSGQGEYSVHTKTLRRKTHSRHFNAIGYRGCEVNSLNHVYDSLTKVMFYMHPETKSLRCWNTNKRLVPENIGTVFVDDKLSTGWSLKIDQSNNLWFMANDLNYFTGEKVAGEVDPLNIYRAKVKELIQDTVCESLLTRSDPNEEDDTEDPLIDVSVPPVNHKPNPSDIMTGDEKELEDGLIL